MAEAKQTLRLSQIDTTHDADIESLIDAATEQVEQDTDRVVISQVFEWTSDSFPDSGGAIQLAQKPIQSVESITYIDADETEQSMPSDAYVLNTGNRQIYLSPKSEWPSAYGTQESVKVSYTAGYGDTEGSVPRMIKRAILLQVGKWFFDPAQEYGDSSWDDAYGKLVDRLLRTSYP